MRVRRIVDIQTRGISYQNGLFYLVCRKCSRLRVLDRVSVATDF